MVATNKQRIVAKLLTVLAKVYEDKFPKELSVLDHLLLGVIQEGISPSRAFAVYESLLAGFHDLNELRVSHPKEIADVLEGLPDAEGKARRILGILQFVFETTYAFDLESMKRKPLKQAERQLSKITGTNAFTVAATVQRALGGHALPIDARMCEVLARLQLIGDGEAPEQIQTCLEHLIPKAKGTSFCMYISELANDPPRCEAILEELAPKSKRKAGKDAPGADEEEPAAPEPFNLEAVSVNGTHDRKGGAPRKPPAPKEP